MKRKIIYLVLCLILITLVGCGGKTKPADRDTVDDIQKFQEELEEREEENSGAEVGKYVEPDKSCFSWEDVEDGVAITEYTGTETAISIPQQLDEKDVVEIKNGTFSNAQIVGVILPDTLKRVGESAFYYCGTLVEVKFGNNVVEIQDKAFQGCMALRNVVLNNSLTNIADYAFGYCSSLKNITIPENVKNIGTGVFCLSGLTSIKIPGSVQTVGRGAFESCANLVEVEIADGMVMLGDEMFEACSSLKEIQIPNSVVDFGRKVFNQCKNVTAYVSAGSPAETYVKENNVNYQTK